MDEVGFDPSREDNLLPPILATSRDRRVMRARQLVARKQGGCVPASARLVDLALHFAFDPTLDGVQVLGFARLAGFAPLVGLASPARSAPPVGVALLWGQRRAMVLGDFSDQPVPCPHPSRLHRTAPEPEPPRSMPIADGLHWDSTSASSAVGSLVSLLLQQPPGPRRFFALMPSPPCTLFPTRKDGRERGERQGAVCGWVEFGFSKGQSLSSPAVSHGQ
jgi:hypothetical protein